jgi:peptide/nickel transport system permease protein
MIVIGTLGIAGAILSEATLSFLGLGDSAAHPELGHDDHQGQEYIFSAWWYSMFPGLTIMLCLTLTV